MEKQRTVKKLRDVPPELTFITLDEIAGRLADLTELQQQILTHLRETTAEGVDVPLPEKVVIGVETINLIREYPYRPLRSIDFFNKGPDTAYYRINEEEKEIPIENRESITVSRPRPTIEYVTLKVAPGESATVKLIGHY